MIFRLALLTTANRKARSARELVRGLVHTAHPLLVQIIPIRRCNIDCGYCNEYDKVSPPVPGDVNINSVLGGGIRNPEDARTINTRARQLGFSTSIGIIHDGSGRLKPLRAVERKVYDDVSAAINGASQVLKNLYSGIRSFQD